MRRIDTTPYTVQPKNAQTALEVVPMDLFEEVVSAGRFNPKELLARMDLLKRLRAQTGLTLFLEDADYATVQTALESVEGFSLVHEEFLRRFYTAPTVVPGQEN